MHCHLADNLAWLYPDSQVPARPVHAFDLDVARGGTAAVQVLVGDATAPVSLKVTGGKARLFRLRAVPVEVNTGAVGFIERSGDPQNPYVTRRAPFRVFDVMQPLKGPVAPEPPDVLAFYVQMPIEPKTRPGRHEIVIEVRSAAETCSLTLRADVHATRVPAVGRDSLKLTNWFSLPLMAQRHRLKPWSPAHWTMIRRYAQMMVAARQNTFLLMSDVLFEVAHDKPRLQVDRLRRLVRLFSEAGMHYIEGPHFATRPAGQWLARKFVLCAEPSIEATSPEGTAWVARMARQLQAEIERNGWADRWLQHIADEPIDENADDYRILAGTVRRYMPGVRILEATLCKAVAGTIDIWVPQNRHYEKDRDFFARQQELGDEVWHYTCCFPGGGYLNRLLDGELLRPTLLHWGNALYDLPGFLHWGLNHYRPSQDPFCQSVVAHDEGNHLPAGDTHVVYPGADGPWSSVRLQAEREGIEDYELLRMLKARNPRRYRTIVHPVIRSFCEYTRELAVFRAARQQLLAALD